MSRDLFAYAIGVGSPAGILWWTGDGWHASPSTALLVPERAAAEAVRASVPPPVLLAGAGRPWLQSVVNVATFWGTV